MHDAVTRDAIVIGDFKEVMEYIPQSVARTEAEERLANTEKHVLKREEQIKEREQSVQIAGIRNFCDSVAGLSRRLDALEARRKEQAMRDAAEEQAAIKRMFDAHPDPDDMDLHTQTGDLHVLAPTDQEPLPRVEVDHDYDS
jgi:hypothetical protein